MMIKRLVSVMGLLLFFAGTKAQVNDAFQGVLPVTDPMMKKSLNGEWQLKVIKGIADNQTVPAVDETWGRIPVPGCWEQYGFCSPSYDKAQPLTGYYHTTFTVPEAWKGQQVFIRFDGVLYGYDLWVNGKSVGTWRSGYNTAIFDITPYIDKKAATQALALRVISQFRGSDFDYNDDWAPNGIFRDVTLMSVPKTHISDLTIRTKNTGEVMVSTDIANAGKDTEVKHEIYDAEGCLVGTNQVEQPHLWTAETPYLYTLKTMLLQKGRPLQTFEHKFGFRELTIDGNILKLNGQPIKLRGVTSHSTDPVTVKVIDETSILRDMKLMKEASINYIRTSHYPREPRFYELADSLGFYIIDEVPFGYGDKNLSDSTFYPMLQQRAQATIRRDKNHPSVLIWSLGNENPLTDICVRLGDYVKHELDPSRPVCYPQVGSYFRRFNYDFPKVADIYAPHYPSTSQIADFYQRADRPVIFTEYCHTLGISLEDHDRQWDIIERTPSIAGGSVWEWVDQGMPFRGKKEDGRGKMYGYEERVFTSDDGGFEMYGNKGTDGLLYADRTPLPNYYELQHNYARAFVSSVSCDGVSTNLTVTNRYDFLDLKDHVTFHWTLTNNRDTVMRGAFSPECEPHSAATYTLNLPRQSGLSLLQFDIEDAQGHTFLHQSFVLNKPQVAWTGHGSGAVMARDVTIRTGRKPTMAERLTQKGRLPEKYLLPLENSQVKADIQSAAIDGGEEISFTMTPDTADVFRSELGLAYLLDPGIDRVQWIGYGPFASYPGRHQANRYGLWAKHMDDLYFEGNHSGIDAALLTDKEGNGILITGDSLSLNFEQTDRGIVVTVNAAVSGQGPKFAKTHFPGWQNGDKPVGATFRSYYIKANAMPKVVSRLFMPAADVPVPFRPFKTQYDTYLLKYPIPSFP
jgi:beta-galactosidase